MQHSWCAGLGLGSPGQEGQGHRSAASSQAGDLELGLVEQSLQKLGLVSVEKQRLRGILLKHSVVRGLKQATRGHSHKLKHKKFHLNIRKSLLMLQCFLMLMLSHKHSLTLHQAAQRGCAATTPGGNQSQLQHPAPAAVRGGMG